MAAMTAPNTGPPERRQFSTLDAEAEAARLLLTEMHRSGYGDDDELLADTVEGETGFLEAVDQALGEADDRVALADAIDTRIKALQARKERVLASAERIRDAITTAVEASGVKLPLRLPTGTLSISTRQGGLAINEDELPAEFFKVETVRKVDRPALLEAIKAGPVPGVTRGNSRRVLTIRR